MNLLTIEHISKSYGDKILFQDVSFGIAEGEKIGIIGVNGTGKSTFLKVIAGLEPPDSGQISVGNRVRIQYLPQQPQFDPEATVLRQVFQGDSPQMRAVREYTETLELLALNENDKALQERLVYWSGEIDRYDAWQLESEAKTVLTKLGVTRFDARVGEMSGGQRKRVALAAALIQPSDLLILDEPTNHIDNASVIWLEQYLQKRKGALLMITHDRYFLDRVAGRMLELDHGRMFSYEANYTRFLELKAEREEREAASEQKRQNLLRNELAWIRRGAKARTTKQKARIDRFEQLQAQETAHRTDTLDVSVASSRLGKKIIEIEHLSKKAGDRTLIRDFSYIAVRDDRVGIVGTNGSGKTTLLNMISGAMPADSGSIAIGPTVKLGYFSQEHQELDEDLRVIEYVQEEAEVVHTADGSVITAAQMLERFLFTRAMQWTKIAKLSGGEKRRLVLLRVLMSAPNVLLLDEPTNDLDIQTLAVLEDYLDEFPGVVFVVSHDRYFLDRTVDKIVAFEGDGVLRTHVGNYSEYEQYAGKLAADAVPSDKASAGAPNGKPSRQEREKQERLRFTYQEQRDFEQIDGWIEETEQKLRDIAEQMEASFSDSVRLQELVQEQESQEQKLEQLMERWTYLNELAEKIAQSK
ncbi:ABC-F family ATP-binding cassette domain-containing protein [Paenibacillus sp. MSJ-34]|uniref:ABC-F family ATP-binding cassette domain-containing protein n=1 Tax=Paenibacillus sp. MSJ-34 TaxID=2841529 RepID=UPI001C1219A6|nr:ABC-F family ATP-binding cassette domain-containing protein [Paenibacillus sp. MSJ-34]MBU5442072.1 ABC-F family ATP-binding cassette domain-containing protein [Paenibacillus sp. MSJ-34]